MEPQCQGFLTYLPLSKTTMCRQKNLWCDNFTVAHGYRRPPTSCNSLLERISCCIAHFRLAQKVPGRRQFIALFCPAQIFESMHCFVCNHDLILEVILNEKLCFEAGFADFPWIPYSKMIKIELSHVRNHAAKCTLA